MKLHEIAHSRTGDKGNTSNVSVIAYRPEDYERIKTEGTAERVKAFLTGIVQGDVVRYDLPEICALNFIMYEALGGGVTRSLALDAHGKALGSALLNMEIDG